MNVKIYTCPEWGAKAPTRDIVLVNKAARIIFHHTASHHRELEPPATMDLEEAFRYARDIQAFHMGPQRGWIDSGHNFLVCRDGTILQGRWQTVSAIQGGRMVLSAHCPGQNDQIGIEHEHKGTEPMTVKQRNASARLQAWIAWQYGRAVVLPVFPHSKFYATSCPANLAGDIAKIKAQAQNMLNAA